MSPVSDAQLATRYERISAQLAELFAKNNDPVARMATISALLHHKMPHFFWTGFYRLIDDKLVVGPYQGPLACAVLDGSEGVCWASVNQGESVIVPDVHAFEGHVACDARSQSEIVVPVRDEAGNIVAVLDVDSDQPDSFSEVDQAGLEKIVALVNGTGL
jgi:L-methionine (R)-S-oxide reductase